MAVDTDAQQADQTAAVAAAVSALESGVEPTPVPTGSAYVPPAPAEPAPAAEPAAVETVTEPAAPATPAEEQFSVHEVWKPLLDQLPEAWKNQALEAIQKTESGANKRIEKLSAERTPDEYRDLIREAQELGIRPDDFVNSYNTQRQMIEQMSADPDAFVANMQAQVDEAVRLGHLTRKEGAVAKQQIEDEVTDLLTPEQQELRQTQSELAQLRETVQQREAREQAAEEARVQQELDQVGRQFITDVEQAFVTAGLVDGNGGHITTRENRAALAQVAAAYLSNDPNLSNVQAIQKAVADIGGLDRFRPAQTPGIPVGGSAAMPPAQTGRPQFASKAEAEAAQIAAIRALQASEAN